MISIPDAATATTSGTTTATATATATTSGTGTATATDTHTETSTSTSTITVLFSDNFDSTYEVNWYRSNSSDGPVTDKLDGSNALVTLDATTTDFTRLRCNLDGQLFKDIDITASMKVRIEQAPTSTTRVRLDVRQAADTENIFYAVGATIANDGSMTKLGIFKKVDDGSGGYTICSLAEKKFATPIAMNNQWHTIKLTISGTTSVQLAAYFEDANMATFVDDCVSFLTSTNGTTVPNGGCLADQTGLGIQAESGLLVSVDDVLVTTP